MTEVTEAALHQVETTGQNSISSVSLQRGWAAGFARSRDEVPVEIFLANHMP